MDDETPKGKVKAATNNEPWGPTGTQMAEIADMTFGMDVREIMATLRERLQEKGSSWRYCYKALNIIEYLVANGSERCIGEAREMLYDIRALERFQYVDREGKDQGVNIRERSKKIVELLNDNDRVYAERDKARANKNKFRGVEGGGGGGGGERAPPPRGGALVSSGLDGILRAMERLEAK